MLFSFLLFVFFGMMFKDTMCNMLRMLKNGEFRYENYFDVVLASNIMTEILT